MQRKIQVLVVDDSTRCRELIIEGLLRDPEIDVVAEASNGEEAVAKAFMLKPTVITMDVEMPGVDGLIATERIMAEMPVPILMLAADPRNQAPELTHRALTAGALALQVKPSLEASADAWDLAREVKLLSTIKVLRHVNGKKIVPVPVVVTPKPAFSSASPVGIVVVASATGGPRVVQKFVSELPADFPAPVVVVQQINAAFAPSLMTWMQGASKLKVQLAKTGEVLTPGVVLMAGPGERVTVTPGGRVSVTAGDALNATTLMETAAAEFGPRCIGLILSGMGQDGVKGMAAIRAAGGVTIAQSQESCMVFGMPGAAIAKGIIDHVVNGDDLAGAVVTLATGGALRR